MPTLHWIGKEAVTNHHKEVPYRMLEPDAELSHGKEDGDGNLIVQGDNLHALKALLPKYAGKVKCIYIDPPYNTGKEEWKYNDNVKAPEIQKWLGQVVGKEAEDLSRHDKWLCMMYPRLLMLKQFLTEDGAIFTSIDDNEVTHLRILLDQIFLKKNHLCTFAWITDGNFDNQAKVKKNHEYIVCYAKNIDCFEHPQVIDPSIDDTSKLKNNEIRNTIVKNGPKNPLSSIKIPIGFPCEIEKGVISRAKGEWPKYSDKLVIKDFKTTNEVSLSSGWSSKKQLLDFITKGFNPILDTKKQSTFFEISKTGAIESYKIRENQSHVISTLKGFSSTQNMSARLDRMGIDFDYPKPVELISYLISMLGEDSIILDSFAGSGTTAHAVMKQNAEDGGNRQFILCEMEANIAETITSERVRRVAGGYTDSKGKEVAGLGGSFQYCRLSEEPLFDANGQVRPDVTFDQLAEFVWYNETGKGWHGWGEAQEEVEESDLGPIFDRAGQIRSYPRGPLLGVEGDHAFVLLYNGILSDRSDLGGNVLTQRTLDYLRSTINHEGTMTVFAARNRFAHKKLREQGITYKQLPYRIEV